MGTQPTSSLHEQEEAQFKGQLLNGFRCVYTRIIPLQTEILHLLGEPQPLFEGAQEHPELGRYRNTDRYRFYVKRGWEEAPTSSPCNTAQDEEKEQHWNFLCSPSSQQRPDSLHSVKGDVQILGTNIVEAALKNLWWWVDKKGTSGDETERREGGILEEEESS